MWEKLSQVSIVLEIIASLKTLLASLKWIIPILSRRKAVFWFEKLRKNPSEEERKKAIEALVKICKKSVSREQQAIIRKYIETLNPREDSGLREAVAIAMGIIGKHSVIPLIDEYENNSSADKEFIEIAFREMKGNKDAKEELLRLLNDRNDWQHRHGAIIALGEINEISVLDDLIRIVNIDAQPEVKAEAIRVIGEFRDVQAIPCLLERIKDENEVFQMKINAVEALETIGDSRNEVVAILTEEAEKESTTHNVRLRAIKALGEMKAYSASSSLINLLNNESIDIQKASIKSLCQICNFDALIGPLRDKALNHNNFEIREACIDAFKEKEKNLSEVREILEEVMIKDPQKLIRDLAFDVLSYIKDIKKKKMG